MLINKKTLEYLAELSRIKIEGRKEEKLLKDLLEILNYFEELKESNTENIEPTRPPEFAQAKSGAVKISTQPSRQLTKPINYFSIPKYINSLSIANCLEDWILATLDTYLAPVKIHVR